MWILSLLPDYFIHLIFLAGVAGTIAGFVLGFIPLINKYKLPIQIISLLVLSLGLYLEGAMSEKAAWELRVKEMEAKVAQAQAEGAVVNTEIVEKIVTKNKIIKEKGDEIIKYIDREVVKLDNTCPIPDLAIQIHNAAATNTPMPAQSAPQETEKPVTPTTIVNTAEHDEAAKSKMRLPKK